MFRLSHSAIHVSAALSLCVAPPVQAQSHTSPHIEAIRFWSFGDVTRVAIQADGAYKLTSDQIERPSRLYFDLTGLRPSSTRHRGVETIQVGDPRLKQIRVAEVSPGRTRVVFDLEGPVHVVSSELVNPARLIIELHPKKMGSSAPLGITSAAAVSVSASQRAAPLAALNKPPLEAVAVGVEDTTTLSTPPQINTTPHIDSPTPGVTTVINSTTDRNRP